MAAKSAVSVVRAKNNRPPGKGRLRRIADDELLANIERATKLREEIQQARQNLHLKVAALKKEVAALRARRRQRN